MTHDQLVFMAIIAVAAIVIALINWWRLTEAKDEIALLKTRIEYNRRTSDMRYKELKGVYMSEYEEIANEYSEVARIYMEEKNNELHA